MKNPYPISFSLNRQKLLLLAFFLGISSMIAQTDLALEAEMAAQEIQNETPSYQTFAEGVGCDNAIPIMSGDLTDELIECGDEDLLNSDSVETFCLDDDGTTIPDYYGGGIEATYTYLPSEDGTVDITIHNTDWTAIMIYDGCPTGDGECVAATRDTTDSRSLSFEAEAGTEYFIWIDVWVTASSASGELCDQGALMDFSGPQPGGLDDCAGVPESITLNAPEGVCGGVSFTISPEDIPAEDGLTYQWQSQPAEDETAEFTDIEEGISKNLTVSSLEESTVYRLTVTCENTDDTVTSEEVTIDLNDPSECFCTPTYSTGCTSGDRITNVTLVGESETINNDSECSPDAYGDYTDLTPADLAPGESYTLSVSTDYSSPSSEDVRAWIDYNGNGTFEDDEEIAYTAGDGLPSAGTGEFEFTVPEIVEPGEYRMRVKMDYSSDDIDSCEGASWGETEDYTVEVIELDECQDPITAGEVVDSELEVCAGIDFQVAVTGASDPANNLTRQWQSSPAGEDDWTDIEGAHANTYTVSDGVDEPTDFRYKVVCADGDPDYSDIIEVNLNPAVECYCTPGGTNSSYYINNFSTSGGEENIENLDSGHSDGGYGDFTETHIVSQAHTLSVDFEANYVGSTFGTKIWVDWNQDGNFDEDEIVYQTSSYSSSESGSIEVPESAELGETRMRIGISYTPSSGPNDPCESGSREFEDYTFEVLALEDCEGTPTAGTVDPEMSVCAGVPFTLSTEGATAAANGLDRIWQSSPAGEDEWTDIEGSNSPEFVLEEGIDEPTDFRYSVNCTLSDESDISEVIEVTLNPAIECYCTPLNTSSTSNYITKVETQGASGTDLNNSSEFSEDGYADYTETETLVVFPGDELDLTTTFQGGTSYVEVWVDWDKDGNFDGPDDHVFGSGSYVSGPHTGTFEIPLDITDGLTSRLRVRVQYLGGSPGPCVESGYGETEDYTIEILPLEDCEGPVSAGTVEDDFEVCAGLPFNIMTSEPSDPAVGLTRKWQSSPAGEDDWTDIEDSHSNNYNVSEGIFEDTDFRYTVFCDNDDETDTSDILSVTLKPGNECYCTPIYSTGCTSGDRISHVTLVGESEIIDNDTGCSPDAYGDFTDLTPADLAPGENYTLSVHTDYSSPSFEQVKAWIDFNQNGNFEDSEEIANTNNNGLPSSGIANFEFIVPADTDPGAYRMRVRMVYGSTPTFDACDSQTYGETEDYTVEVIELEDCEGTPTAGTIDEEDFNVCASTPFSISVSGASDPANGLDRIWQSSPEGEDNWTDIEGAHSNTYSSTEGIEEPTDFRYKVTCNFSEETDISNVITVSLKPAVECYCIPENNSNSSYYISNVSTEGALQDIDNDSEFSDNGYEDYSETEIITVYPGQEFDYSITGSSSSMSYGMWLDLDQNGNFDGPLELIADSNPISAPFTGTYQIPTDLDEGNYRLRVRVNWLFALPGPCEDSTYGETEDYTIEVIFPECFPPVDIQVDYITDDSAQVNWEANEEDSWVVIYGEQGFNPEEGGTTIEVENTPSADLTDLDNDTTYDVYVQTICGDDESVAMGPVTFTTNITPPENTRLCDAIPLEPNTGCIGGPYTNVAAFEEAGEPIGTCHNDYRGKNTVWFTFEASGDGEAVITTDFNSTEIQTEIVVFEAPTDCEDISTLGEEVGCANAADDGLLELEGLTPGATYYVKVGGFNNTEGEFCIEVQLEEVPVCFAPTEITIGEISDETVDVSWTAGGDETQWEVIYDEAGFNPAEEGQSMVVNTTEVTLIDLTPDTDYEVYVRAICTNLNSDLAGPEPFTTDEMSVDSQVFANFTFYPNPVKDQLTLKAGSQIESVEVYNLLGKNVISAKPNSLEAQINTESLQSGVYLMEVNINGSQKTFRVVKK